MSRGQSLYSEVQVEQVLSCLWEGGLYTVRSKLNEFRHVLWFGGSLHN